MAELPAAAAVPSLPSSSVPTPFLEPLPCSLELCCGALQTRAALAQRRRYASSGMLGQDRDFAVPTLVVYLVLLFLRPLPLLYVIASRRSSTASTLPHAVEAGQPPLDRVKADAAVLVAEPRATLVLGTGRNQAVPRTRSRARSHVW